jgi:hypothetical protein
MDFQDSFEKLQELYQMGFIVQAEYELRLQKIGKSDTSLSTQPGSYTNPNHSLSNHTHNSLSPQDNHTASGTVDEHGFQAERCAECGSILMFCLCKERKKKDAEESRLMTQEDWQAERCTECGSLVQFCLCEQRKAKEEEENRVLTENDWQAERCSECGSLMTLCLCSGTKARDEKELKGDSEIWTDVFKCAKCEKTAEECYCHNGYCTCGKELTKITLSWQQPRCTGCGSYPSLCLCR